MSDLNNGAETTARNMERQLAAILEKRPALENVVRPFTAVFTAKAVLVQHLSRELDLDGLEFEVSGLTSGAPLASHWSFKRLKPELNRSFKTLVPVLKHSFPAIAAELDRLEFALEQDDLDLVRLAEDFLKGNPKCFANQTQQKGISPGCLEFAVNFTLSAVLQALERRLKSIPGLTVWKKGDCPICGSMPSIGFLAKSSLEGSEFLKSGGGQKYLHCPLCGHDWRINRHACPACATEEIDQGFYLQVQNETAERVDICRKCGRYLPILDMRQSTAGHSLDLASVGLLHLEILARQKGYHPMTWTPWNREG